MLHPWQGSLVPRILPRVVLELAPQQHLEALRDSRSAALQMLAKEARRQGFDGLVGCLLASTTKFQYGRMTAATPHIRGLASRGILQVLEAWTVWAAYGILAHYEHLVVSFVTGLAQALHRQKGRDGRRMVGPLQMPAV